MKYLKNFESIQDDIEKVKNDLREIAYLLEDDRLTYSIIDSKNSVVDYYMMIVPMDRRRYLLKNDREKVSNTDDFIEFVDRAKEIFIEYGFNLGKPDIENPKILFEIKSINPDKKPWE